MSGLPTPRVLADLDCGALNLPAKLQRCDYFLVTEDNDSSLVAPIELKGGRVRGSEVAAQLQQGAKAAEKWLPPGASFRLVPILVHRRGIHKHELKHLRGTKIRLRGRQAQTVLIRCGAPLKRALDQA